MFKSGADGRASEVEVEIESLDELCAHSTRYKRNASANSDIRKPNLRAAASTKRWKSHVGDSVCMRRERIDAKLLPSLYCTQ